MHPVRRTSLLALLALMLASTLPHAFAHQKSYIIPNERRFPVYAWITALRAGDLNNDGWIDVAAVTHDDRLRMWFQDPGCHELKEVSDTFIDVKPLDLAIVDLNADGLNDVVVLNKASYVDGDPGTVAIFYQSANGFDQPPIRHPVSSMAFGRVAVGDVTHDNHVDIAVLTEGHIDILAQAADRTFSPAVTYATPLANAVHDLALADFTNDGRNDIAIIGQKESSKASIMVYAQQPAGGFDPPITLPAITYYGVRFGMTAGDVTGDGRADIIVSVGANTPSAYLALYTQQPGGGFGAPSYTVAEDVPSNPVLHDMDGNGLLDVVLQHNGWRAFTTYYQSVSGGLGSYEQSDHWFADEVVSRERNFAVGDVTGDGLPDIVHSTHNIGLAVVTKGSLPVCPQPEAPPPAAQVGWNVELLSIAKTMTTLVAADINQDGRSDLVGHAFPENQVLIARQTADASFETMVPAFSTQEIPYSLAAGDLDGDGRTDISVADNSGIEVAYQNDNGTFAPPIAIAVASWTHHLLLADWTGDQRTDIAAIVPDGVFVLSQQLDGTLGSPSRILTEPINSMLTTQADWNGDGRADIITSGSQPAASNTRVFLQQENGTFQRLAPRANTFNSASRDIAVADINHDGHPDIIVPDVANAPHGRLVVFEQQMDGSLGERTILSEPGWQSPCNIAVTDLNGDHRNDILVMNSWTYFSTLTQNSSAQFDPLQMFAYPQLNFGNICSPRTIAVIDDNHDGTAEMLAYGMTVGHVAILRPYAVVMVDRMMLPLVQS